MTPSVPVESREQPRHRAIAASIYEQWRCACGWAGSGDFWVHIDQELTTTRAERDRARDLAAHALAIEPLDDETDFAAGYNEARSDFRAVLAAHLEADAAKLREAPRR